MNRLALAVVLISVAGLTACATPTPASSPTAEAPSPTPTETAVVVSIPKPLVDVGCSDLASDAEVSTQVNDDVHTADLRTGMGLTQELQLQQLGGFSCRWENDVPETNMSTGPQNYNMILSALPRAGGKWERYADAYGITGDTFTYCYDYAEEDDPSFFCGYFAYVNDVWIELYLEGADKPGVVGDKAVVKSVTPFFASIRATFASADYIEEPWVAPAGTAALPSKCESFATGAQLKSATGVSKALDTYTYVDGPQVSMTLSLDNVYLVKECSFAPPTSDSRIGDLAALAGGAWVWEDPSLFPSNAQPVDVPGLATDERALTSCTDNTCTLDLLLGGNWISVTLGDYEWLPKGYEITVDKSEALVAIATDIVANLKG